MLGAMSALLASLAVSRVGPAALALPGRQARRAQFMRTDSFAHGLIVGDAVCGPADAGRPGADEACGAASPGTVAGRTVPHDKPSNIR